MFAFFLTKRTMTRAGWKGPAQLLPAIFAGAIGKGFIDISRRLSGNSNFVQNRGILEKIATGI
jgi:hypothetical protein